MALLKVEGLKKYYPIYKGLFRGVGGWVKAVDGVSLEMGDNEVLGIVGESGSGKTTLGRCIVNLVRPTEGVISLNGPVQMIFQDPGGALNPRHTIGEALLEPLLYHKVVTNKKEAEDIILDWLDKIGFDGSILNRFPHEFSLGQKQRLAIVRALLMKPRLIVCDEPVSALDVSIQAQILNLFIDLKERLKMSLLFISHDLSVVRFLADRTLVMHQGRIVEEGVTESLFSHPQHSYTKRLLASCPGRRP